MRVDQDEAAGLLDGLDLDTLLGALTQGRGYEAALRDPPGRHGWSDVRPASLSFLELDQRIDRLARLLSINKARPGSGVAILAPMGPEAILATMASLRAGLSPVLLPLHGNELELLALIERSGAVMALGTSRVGSLRPLLVLRNLAMRAFGTRFVGGFGPDIPDGVAPLEALMASEGAHPLPPQPGRAGIQVTDAATMAGPFPLSERELLGKALELSRLLRPELSARIVTTLVGGDLAALASGLGVALLTGIELLPLGLFALGDLHACFEAGRPVHLVLPGAMEPALAQSRLAAHPALASVVFVQRTSEARFHPAIDRPGLVIVDIVARAANEIAIERR